MIFLWGLMAFLAFGVAGYAIAILFLPGIRPPIVLQLMTDFPVASKLHFVGGAVAMAVGALQLSTWLRNRYLTLHRWMGRLYLAGVAVGGAAGFLLAINSTAGNVARWGFALLAVAWLVTTAIAYRHIRARDVAAHRRWMIRSYAVTYAAVMLRLYLPAAIIGGMNMEAAYPAIAWLCWVPNLLFAEWLLRSSVVPANAGTHSPVVPASPVIPAKAGTQQ